MKNFIHTLLLIAITFISLAANAAELKAVEGEVTPPAFTLETLKGDNSMSLSDFKGQVVLVQFWATYCTPCRLEMPSMNKLMKSLEDNKIPFKILAINMGETKEEVQKFVDEVKPAFTILMDSTGENVQKWNVFAAPSNFLIGKKGNIRYTLYGGVDWNAENISTTIKALAAEGS